jgi:CDP-diacylglycerol--serine O-phosphatidyltransferase
MISKFSYFSFKNFGDKEKIKFYWLFFIIFLLVITLINPTMVLLVLTITYAASGPVINLLRQFKKRKVIYADKKRDSYEK